jgi:benzodiazapine receptor
MNTLLSLLIILLPSLFGYISALFCKVRNTSGSSVSFRPKSPVFSIAWIILYILLGLSWYYVLEENINTLNIVSYLILNIFLCLWLYFYACKNEKINAIYILVICFTLSIFCYTLGNLKSKLLITPLIGWLFFATLINVAEVQK